MEPGGGGLWMDESSVSLLVRSVEVKVRVDEEEEGFFLFLLHDAYIT